MSVLLGSSGIFVGAPPAVPGAYPSARGICQNVPVGTTQILEAPPTGYVWVITPWLVVNTDVGVGDVLIFDSDGALGQMQAWAVASITFCQTLSDKAVSITTAVTLAVNGIAFLMPKPEIYLVVKPTAAFAAVPIVVPAGKIAVPAFARFRGENFPTLSPPNNYIRGVNADTAGALSTQVRLSRGAVVGAIAVTTNGKSNGLCNQNTQTAWASAGSAITAADLLEVKLSAAPTVAGSYVARVVYELIPAF